MTLLDFVELCGHWQKCPPVHLSVAAYLQIGQFADDKSQTPQTTPGFPAQPTRSPRPENDPGDPVNEEDAAIK